jgi:hypothetical protein
MKHADTLTEGNDLLIVLSFSRTFCKERVTSGLAECYCEQPLNLYFTCTQFSNIGLRGDFTLQSGFMMGNENRISLIQVNTSSRETLLSKIGLKIIWRFLLFEDCRAL